MEQIHKDGRIRQFIVIVLYFPVLISFFAVHNIYADTHFRFDTLFDESINDAMQDHGIPGAVIVIVKDDELYFSKGYGYANLEDGIHVDPSRTLFRVGSISKVITGTAMMQMIERGYIDPHADVNNYLHHFQIPDTFKEPITTDHLLTHTAGFDDRYIGKSAPHPGERISLAEYCKKYLPQRFIEPGKIYTYSNYGNALAGYLVETVSGVPFAEYIDSSVLKPLGMHHSGFELTEDFEPYLARGYSDLSGEYRSLPFDYLLDAPAGQFIATGEDMARFMTAHLRGGELDGERLLSEESAGQMHSVQFKNHPRLHDGTGYTFNISTMNGEHTLSHGGAYAGFYALMTLFPEHNTGVFIAHNILKTNFVSGVMEMILDRLFDPTGTVLSDAFYTAPERYDTNVGRFTGTYRHTRYPRSTFDKVGILLGAMGGEMKIRKNEKGMLLMPDIFGNDRRLVQVEPLVFRSLDDNYSIAFRENDNGAITHVFTSGVDAMERIPWYHSVALHRILFIVYPLIFLTITGVFIVGYIIRTFRPHRHPVNRKRHVTLKRLHVWIAATFLLYMILSILVIGALVSVDELVGGFPYGLPGAMYIVQLVPLLMIFLTIGLSYCVIREWFGDRNDTTFIQRIYYSGYVGVSATAILFLEYWNLIGFHF